MQTSKAEGSVAITPNGSAVGHSVTDWRRPTEADIIAFREAHARVQADMAAAGVTEEDIMADFEERKAAEKAARSKAR